MSIETQLEDLIVELRAGIPQIDDLPEFTIFRALLKALRDPDNSVARFQASVLADETFGDLRDGWIGSSLIGSAIQEHTLSLTLIHAVLQGQSPNLIVSQTRAFAERKTSELLKFFAVAGASIVAPVVLHQTMRILPWEEVPESRTKTRLSSRNGEIRPYYPTDEIVPHRTGAGLAIEISNPVGLQLLSSCGPRPQSGGEYLAHFESERLDYERAEDVVRCLFLMSQKPVGIIAEWPIAADPAADRHFGGHLTYRRTLFDLSFTLPNDGKVDGAELISLWQRYSDLQSNDRDTMRYVIDRLNLAKRRSSVVDSAIDLGIALEMLILHNLKSKSELKFRLSLCGATFIGGMESDRKSNFKILQKIYDLRSSAVHNGRLSRENVEIAPALVENGIKLAAAIARKVIVRGRFPDCEAEYLFGSDDLDPSTSSG